MAKKEAKDNIGSRNETHKRESTKAPRLGMGVEEREGKQKASKDLIILFFKIHNMTYAGGGAGVIVDICTEFWEEENAYAVEWINS